MNAALLTSVPFCCVHDNNPAGRAGPENGQRAVWGRNDIGETHRQSQRVRSSVGRSVDPCVRLSRNYEKHEVQSLNQCIQRHFFVETTQYVSCQAYFKFCCRFFPPPLSSAAPRPHRKPLIHLNHSSPRPCCRHPSLKTFLKIPPSQLRPPQQYASIVFQAYRILCRVWVRICDRHFGTWHTFAIDNLMVISMDIFMEHACTFSYIRVHHL